MDLKYLNWLRISNTSKYLDLQCHYAQQSNLLDTNDLKSSDTILHAMQRLDDNQFVIIFFKSHHVQQSYGLETKCPTLTNLHTYKGVSL